MKKIITLSLSFYILLNNVIGQKVSSEFISPKWEFGYSIGLNQSKFLDRYYAGFLFNDGYRIGGKIKFNQNKSLNYLASIIYEQKGTIHKVFSGDTITLNYITCEQLIGHNFGRLKCFYGTYFSFLTSRKSSLSSPNSIFVGSLPIKDFRVFNFGFFSGVGFYFFRKRILLDSFFSYGVNTVYNEPIRSTSGSITEDKYWYRNFSFGISLNHFLY